VCPYTIVAHGSRLVTQESYVVCSISIYTNQILYILQLQISYSVRVLCQKLWRLVESGHNYCNRNPVFFGPPSMCCSNMAFVS